MLDLQQTFDIGNRVGSRYRRVSFLRTANAGGASCRLSSGARGESGLTLLEVVIAMAILSVAVVGLVGGLSFAISVSDTLEEQAVTETLAARYVEEHLNGACLPEDSSMGGYRIEGLEVEEVFLVRVTSDGEELFELSSLAGEVTACPESEVE